MPHTLVRQYECCGRDAHGNPCFDVIFVERDIYYSPFAVQKVQKLNFRGPALWVDCPLRS